MFPDVKVPRYSECVNPSHLSSPTCEDLGIPWSEVHDESMCYSSKTIRHPSLHLEAIRYDAISKTDPFSPFSMIPVPSTFGFDSIEPTFIRKRNERERDRVRCVNDGYVQLKEHLPIDNKDKRISKVETLRTAIDYIKHLERLLERSSEESQTQTTDNCDVTDVKNDACEFQFKMKSEGSCTSSDNESFTDTRSNET